MPVRFTFHVLVSVNTCVGPAVPMPRVAVGLQVAGVRVAVRTGVTPVPLRPTGEPVTATLALMVNVPVDAPAAVGVNTTLIVQLPVTTLRVAGAGPQVPPPPPVARA